MILSCVTNNFDANKDLTGSMSMGKKVILSQKQLNKNEYRNKNLQLMIPVMYYTRINHQGHPKVNM